MNTETIEYTETVEERPVHMARCADCDHAVRFRPNSSGTGFFLVGTEELYGVGALGRPVCPNGHGEMELADDRLPIEQAMQQVAEQLTEPQRLPFPSPPFNYEGALHEIFEMEKENAILESKFNDADERRKKAKAALDDGRSKLSALIGTLQEREQDRLHEIARREAAKAAGHPEETNLVRCAWEQAHPDDDCPICASRTRPRATTSATRRAIVRCTLMPSSDWSICRTPKRSSRWCRTPVFALAAPTVNGWSVEDRAAVKFWAEHVPEDNNPRPAILGTAHVAADFTTSEAVPGDTFQSCTECGARLLTNKTGDDEGASFEPYPAGTLVGTDCAGAKEPARYAKRGKRAKAAK
jgi:hypothetical protein